MRSLRSLMLYMLFIFAGGALLAPQVYALVQWSAPQVEFMHKLAVFPLHRYMTRCFTVLALVGLWPFLKTLGAQSRHDVGLSAHPAWWRDWLGGFTLGFASVGLAAVLCLWGGACTTDFNHTTNQFIRHFLNAAAAALLVGTVEELVFRGSMYGGFKRAFGWKTAFFVSSAVYGIVHFFSPMISSGAVSWYSGLLLLPQMAAGFFEWDHVIPGFINLTLVGMLLALAYERTGALYACIGLHGGWIFWLKTYGFLTTPLPKTNTWFWGSNRLTDGWVLLFVLAACFPIVLKHFRHDLGGDKKAV